MLQISSLLSLNNRVSTQAKHLHSLATKLNKETSGERKASSNEEICASN